MVLAVATSPVSMHSIPSRKSSFRKFGSRSTRARIVSLKSRVRGIVALLLPSFVILPVSQGNGDVVVLTFFATTANQNHQAIAILTKVKSDSPGQNRSCIRTYRNLRL